MQNLQQTKVTKVIIPAAGFGTRFLPQTKSMPKEMLPIVDKPVIQYVVEEAISAAIRDVIIVTGVHKRAIEDHFDYSFELETRLKEWGKEALIPGVRSIAEMANFIYVRQKGPYGNATPITCSRHLVEGSPFLVLWADEFMVSTPTRAQLMCQAYEKYLSPVICGFESHDPEDAKKYAFVEGKEISSGVWKVNRLIEKPGIGKAPSNIAIVSGYVLDDRIFPVLENQKAGKGGEFYLPEAIDTLARSTDVYAVVMKDYKYYDTGNKLSYMKTIVEMALRHDDLKDDFKNYLKELVK